MIVPVTAAAIELARFVRPGDGIVFGQGTGEPLSLTKALVQQRSSLSGATVFIGTSFSDTFQPEHADHLRFRSFGAIGTLRKLAAAGKLDPTPCHISSIGPMLSNGTIRSDVVMVSVSPPNERGEHSFGLVNDYVRAAIGRARIVLAEVNPNVPWTYCDQPLSAKDIRVVVEAKHLPLELPPAKFGPLERRIAAGLADIIPDRATLQVGIGAVPEAIVSMLKDRKNLGVHSGMIGDSVAELVESGAVTNAFKGIDEGVTVSGVLFGTRKLYNFAHLNEAVRLDGTHRTHAVETLRQVRRLVSINSALEVDLTGQVNAESIGADHIGAVGGQVDFVRGAAISPDGVSIIALPSIGKGGASRIVARLSGPVTTARSDVDVVATEHGVVRLRGLGLRERMKALIGIADPMHRESLEQEAAKMWKCE